MSTPGVEITLKSAGRAGVTTIPGQALPPKGLKIPLVPFMLEDYLDAIDTKRALDDPENRERIPWEQLKDQLGL